MTGSKELVKLITKIDSPYVVHTARDEPVCVTPEEMPILYMAVSEFLVGCAGLPYDIQRPSFQHYGQTCIKIMHGVLRNDFDLFRKGLEELLGKIGDD